MLFRVSGVLSNGKRFGARIESPDSISAVGSIRTALSEAQVAQTDVVKIQSQPVKGGKTIKFSDARAPKAKAAKTAAPSKK